MKYAIQYLILLCITVLASTKFEAQNINQDNKKETMSDKASNTIQTLKEISDTVKLKKDNHIKKNNE